MVRTIPPPERGGGGGDSGGITGGRTRVDAAAAYANCRDLRERYERDASHVEDAGEKKDDDEYNDDDDDDDDDARRRSHPFRLTPSYLEFLGNVDKRRSSSWYCCDRSDTNSNISAWSLSAVGRDDDDDEIDDDIDDDARNSYTEEDAFASRMGSAFLHGMNFDGKVVPPADVGVGGGGGGVVVGSGPYLMKYSPSYLSERSEREDDDGNASSTWSFSAVGAE